MFDLQSLVKYLLEGLAVAVAAFLIPRKTVDPKEVALIALTAAAVFAVLDQFAPLVGQSTRQGAGFGIGLQQVGWGGPEGFTHTQLPPHEGYDDYASEGFQTLDNPQSTEDLSTVCKMEGDVCGYDPNVKDENREIYVCQKDVDKCEPVKACEMSDTGECNWVDQAKLATSTDTRICQPKDVNGSKHCVLTNTNTTEGFQGSADDIQGFEGFSKVF